MSDDGALVSRWITESGAVVVPPRIAYDLEKKAGITGDYRDNLRTSDPLAHVVLFALHVVAMSYKKPVSELGQRAPSEARLLRESDAWLTTREAASEFGVTDRTIRRWCDDGRLASEFRGGQYRIHWLAVRALQMSA